MTEGVLACTAGFVAHLPGCLVCRSAVCVALQVYSFSTASMPDAEGARLALKRHLGDLATMRGRNLASPLPMLPLGSQDNDTASQARHGSAAGSRSTSLWSSLRKHAPCP